MAPIFFAASVVTISASGTVGSPAAVLLSTLDTRGIDDLTLTDPVTQLVDNDADGHADVSIPTIYGQFIAFGPTLATAPISGQTSVDLYGMAGHTIQLRATDVTGNAYLGVLGSIVFSGYVPLSVALSRPLVGSEYVMPVDVTSNTRPGAPEQVGTASASVPAASPPALALCALLLATLASWRLKRKQRPDAG